MEGFIEVNEISDFVSYIKSVSINYKLCTRDAAKYVFNFVFL